MYDEMVEPLLLEVTTEADEDEENKPDETSLENEKRRPEKKRKSSHPQHISSKVIYPTEEPWVVKTPKHTYQRKAVCIKKEIDCPPDEESIMDNFCPSEFCQTEMDLGPTLIENSSEKYCIEFQFPPLSYQFEDMQALILMQIEASEILEEKKDSALPFRHITDSVACTKPDEKDGIKQDKKTFEIPRKINKKPKPVKKKAPPAKQCEYCGKIYTCQTGSHLESCRAVQKDITCPDCGKVLATVKTFRRHRKIHLRQGGVKYHVCDVCQKGFCSGTSLRRHMFIHKGEKPHVCEECGRAFREKGQLSYHLTIHTGVKKIRCPDCGKQFMYPSIMKLHKCRPNQED